MRYVTLTLFLAILTCSVAGTAMAQGRGFRGGRGPGQGGPGPGRGGRGPDQDFVVDRDDFHFLLEHHDQVRREVRELKDGVETLTESDNKEVAARIQKHVAAMYQRVEQERPIRMRDPLFVEIFRHADQIRMKLETTRAGVRVVETSDDPYVAQLIKSHAKVVSGFAAYGFEEAHKTHAIPGKPSTGDVPMHTPAEMANIVFVEFDRVYIPALALTNQMKQALATEALERLSELWDARFVGHFHRLFRQDAKWPGDMSRIAQAIALAQAELKSGEAQRAHEELEPVRDILTDARRRNNVDYPLDSLSQFHATMEAIVKPALKLDAAAIDQSQIAEFAQLSKRAEQEWRVVEETEFDLAIFGKNEQLLLLFPSLLRAERTAIEQLNDALANGNAKAILKAAKSLKPPFAKVYMFFGDFPAQADATH